MRLPLDYALKEELDLGHRHGGWDLLSNRNEILVPRKFDPQCEEARGKGAVLNLELFSARVEVVNLFQPERGKLINIT